MCAFGGDCLADGLAFVAAQIVQDDGIAGSELWGQVVGDIVLEDLSVHWPVEDQGRDDTVLAQTGHEG